MYFRRIVITEERSNRELIASLDRYSGMAVVDRTFPGFYSSSVNKSAR